MNIPYSFAKRKQLLYLGDPKASLLITKQTTQEAISEARRFLQQQGLVLETLTQVESAEFEKQLAKVYSGGQAASQEVAMGIEDHPDLLELADQVPESEDLMDTEASAPIVKLINALLSEAIRLGASDIHIETFEKRLKVRFRVDGELKEVISPKRQLAPLLVSRIKVLARLDIAEKRVPQDGRISLKLAGREVDVRVSTLPSSFGERVVLRILDKQAGRMNLKALGLKKRDFKTLSHLIGRPHGIILVTGPTGSGKTTTLYAALSELNDGSKNIMTAEDPVEYQLEGISQTQVNTKVDLSFARSLRAMLRQDPDVMMVGEIRDLETAQIAVQASLTGHLVISTLHTNTAIGAVTRLRDMGVEPFLLSGSLIGVVAQRLVRVLCQACAAVEPTDKATRQLFSAEGLQPPEHTHVAVGCEQCNQSGFKGRTAIYEVVALDAELARLIHSEAPQSELEAHAKHSYGSIRADGLSKVTKGVTSLSEVIRVTSQSADL